MSAFLKLLFKVGCHKTYTNKLPKTCSELVALLSVLLSPYDRIGTAGRCQQHLRCCFSLRDDPLFAKQQLVSCATVSRGFRAWRFVNLSRLQPVEPAFEFLKDFDLFFAFLEVSLWWTKLSTEPPKKYININVLHQQVICRSSLTHSSSVEQCSCKFPLLKKLQLNQKWQNCWKCIK